jgi:hypothetical protein
VEKGSKNVDFWPKKVDFTLKTRVSSMRFLQKYADNNRVNVTLHQIRGTFFVFREDRELLRPVLWLRRAAARPIFADGWPARRG